MVHQLPAGARDLLPIDVVQKQWIEDRLQQVFHQWGYHRIITSTLERLDTLMAGGAVERDTVIDVQDADDDDLGLRPELTASIARTAVTRLAKAPFPQRLCYNANVFRRAQRGSHNHQQEFYQAGVELLGGGGLIADAEILLLIIDCVQRLGFATQNQQSPESGPGWHLILGEAGLTRSLLSVFPEPWRDKVRWAIAHLDRMALETLPLSPDLRDRALFLLDLRGQPRDVLQRLSTLDLDSPQQEAVNHLKALVDLLADSFAEQSGGAVVGPQLVLDLSLIQTIDYYTGIVFEIVSDAASGQRILGQGGRYDQLLGLYHPQGQAYPGIGFALNTEEIYQVLLPQGHLPYKTPAIDWLIVPASPQVYEAAFAQAQQLRDGDQQVRVEMSLGNYSTPEAIREYAYQRRIGQIVWINTDSVSTIETVS
ncbi:ATP phosphoribosyltransferase regulatory subunit [Leptolyngbya sp. 'hensonii']|uniref:ATP phosphoribosyltransferase regulatory subunit n=1 Tax=Leptolyngbya sp. 'hensonii' TaxID=1922337 RepID=UPI000950303A|nr:ATP phosphoribosyltransferase regulatory subunit [Leptolyngbya sp. 'hensonii']OLP16584.1 ATP phosphoribosyltransferase regulatory subunit [Leptolyngbya sp. 'hensonii']